jgi:uncharacterized membrane protein
MHDVMQSLRLSSFVEHMLFNETPKRPVSHTCYYIILLPDANANKALRNKISSVMEPQNEYHGFPLKNEPHGTRPGRFFHPYLQLSISIVLTAAAQIFLKIGVDSRLGTPGYGFLASLWIWTGISAILLSLLSWLYALKSVPLSVAFNLAATNHILVAIGAWAFLGEKITQQRWLGISLVALGTFFIARRSSLAEEKL